MPPSTTPRNPASPSQKRFLRNTGAYWSCSSQTKILECTVSMECAYITLTAFHTRSSMKKIFCLALKYLQLRTNTASQDIGQSAFNWPVEMVWRRVLHVGDCENDGCYMHDVAELDQSGINPERRPRCSTKGSKSRSLYSNGRSFSMHAVAMRVSMVLRTVTPIRRSVRKLRAA